MSKTEDWKETYTIMRIYEKDNEHHRCEIEDMIYGLAHHVHKNPAELFDGKKEFHFTIGPHVGMADYIEARMVRRPVDRHMRPEVKDIIRRIIALNDELNILNPEVALATPRFPGKHSREEYIKDFFACQSREMEILEVLK